MGRGGGLGFGGGGVSGAGASVPEPSCGRTGAANAVIGKLTPSKNAAAMTPANRRVQYLWRSDILMM
jgi:hypothetical protein